MRLLKTNPVLWLAVALAAACIFSPRISLAQGNTPQPNALTGINANDEANVMQDQSLRETLGDPREEDAFKKFHIAEIPDKKVQLGEAFLNKYPLSHHAEDVYQELAEALYAKKDMADFYTYSDKGIKLFPDDVVLLTMSGTVIPRAYDHNDPNADQRLDQAEGYDKHAIEVVNSSARPANMSDKQFSDYKALELATAHSGLGLIYFRRGQYDDSVKELQQATTGAANPDATDLFVLGADFQSLNQFKQAADAFGRCAQVAGSLQASCKQYADQAAKQAAQAQ